MRKIIINNNISATVFESSEAIGNIIIAHGMMEHQGRYIEFAKYLNKHNYNVVLFDQLGHGDSNRQTLGHWRENDFKKSVENYQAVVEFTNEMYKDLKTFLFAHSMGSFIAQEYITIHSKAIDGLILSGSSGPMLSVKLGAIVTKLFKTNNRPNQFFHNLMFKPYTSIFKPKRSEFDWLSSVENEVDKYIDDPLCGFVCTTGFFKEFITSISMISSIDKIKKIREDLPLLLISGNDDPVGGMGKEITKLSNLYLKNGLKSVNLLLYPNARHELLNEFCREKVMEDVINWLRK